MLWKFNYRHILYIMYIQLLLIFMSYIIMFQPHSIAYKALTVCFQSVSDHPADSPTWSPRLYPAEPDSLSLPPPQFSSPAETRRHAVTSRRAAVQLISRNPYRFTRGLYVVVSIYQLVVGDFDEDITPVVGWHLVPPLLLRALISTSPCWNPAVGKSVLMAGSLLDRYWRVNEPFIRYWLITPF